MKKILLISSLLLMVSTQVHAGLLDKVTKTAADVDKAQQQVADAKKSTTDPKALITLAIKNKLGSKPDKNKVVKLFGKPSATSVKKATGEEVYQYDISAIRKGLGEDVALASSFGVASKLSQVVQITFKDNLVTQYNVVDAAVALPVTAK